MLDELDNNASDLFSNMNIEERVSNNCNMNRYQETQTGDKLNAGTIPKSHVLIHNPQLSMLRSKGRIYNLLVKKYFDGLIQLWWRCR